MNGLAGVLAYAKDNPVLLLDLLKYALACLVLFGLPIPAGLVVAVLTLVTAGQVTPAAKAEAARVDALYTPVPSAPAAIDAEGNGA